MSPICDNCNLIGVRLVRQIQILKFPRWHSHLDFNHSFSLCLNYVLFKISNTCISLLYSQINTEFELLKTATSSLQAWWTTEPCQAFLLVNARFHLWARILDIVMVLTFPKSWGSMGFDINFIVVQKAKDSLCFFACMLRASTHLYAL